MLSTKLQRTSSREYSHIYAYHLEGFKYTIVIMTWLNGLQIIIFCGYSQQKNILAYNMLMVRYVDMDYSKLKEECENRGIKKYFGLRKPILMILLIMHDSGYSTMKRSYQ